MHSHPPTTLALARATVARVHLRLEEKRRSRESINAHRTMTKYSCNQDDKLFGSYHLALIFLTALRSNSHGASRLCTGSPEDFYNFLGCSALTVRPLDTTDLETRNFWEACNAIEESIGQKNKKLSCRKNINVHSVCDSCVRLGFGPLTLRNHQHSSMEPAIWLVQESGWYPAWTSRIPSRFLQ